jgi:exopolyphosphatase / guanosine-5'-triphosphate,3'-diphosphate pyrophosphatase
MAAAASASAGEPVRVAVLDLGTNSTRLLVADVAPGGVRELERRTTVTRLGRGVDTSGTLAGDAVEEVCATVAEYVGAYAPLAPNPVVAIATSAVRDARNGGAFLAELRERFALDARIVDGAEEARLTYLGATYDHAAAGDEATSTLVVDIGGGSTELIVGIGAEATFFDSLQVGVVRHTERHIAHDPPLAAELEALAGDVQALIDSSLDGELLDVERGIAVAGTPTSLAAIEQGLEPYDPSRVHGYVLGLPAIQRMCSTLASLPLAERRRVRGLQPARAPMIVAGVVILAQVMRAFGLEEVEVSEHDILWGAAIDAAAAPAAAG